jgi:hypothetical protein
MLDLEFLAADSGGLVPMYFSKVNRSILEADPRNTLAFSPSAFAIDAAKPRDFPYRAARREGLDA